MLARFVDFLRILITGINIYIFFFVIMNTAITFYQFLFSILVYYILLFFLYKKIQEIWIKAFGWFDYFGIIIPFIFNSFFFINYYFSSNPKIETYFFLKNPTIGGSKYQSNYADSTTITLMNGDFQDFYFFRTFPDYTKMQLKNHITMHTEKGFFGFLVLKNYKFSH